MDEGARLFSGGGAGNVCWGFIGLGIDGHVALAFTPHLGASAGTLRSGVERQALVDESWNFNYRGGCHKPSRPTFYLYYIVQPQATSCSLRLRAQFPRPWTQDSLRHLQGPFEGQAAPRAKPQTSSFAPFMPQHPRPALPQVRELCEELGPRAALEKRRSSLDNNTGRHPRSLEGDLFGMDM